MKTSLSKGAMGVSSLCKASCSARPGRNGLYGKNPTQNITIANGKNRFAIVSKVATDRELGELAIVPTCP